MDSIDRKILETIEELSTISGVRSRRGVHPDEVIEKLKLSNRDYADHVEYLKRMGLLQVYTGMVAVPTSEGQRVLQECDKSPLNKIWRYVSNEYKNSPVKTVASTLTILIIIFSFILNNLAYHEASNSIINSPTENIPVNVSKNLSYDNHKVNNTTIVVKPNQPPKVYELSSDRDSPQNTGTTVTWDASAIDSDGDQILYQFLLNNNPETEWTKNNEWIWTTSDVDVGDNRIEVRVKDGFHATQADYDDHRSVGFAVTAPNNSPFINSLTTDKRSPFDSRPSAVNDSFTNAEFARFNEYVENGVQPNCEPGTKQATCSSPYSCVDCNGRCWPPDTYDSGTTCSQGKWTLIGYIRTNEYVNNGVEPNCKPGTKQATCSSPDSCVDCNGKCWPPGSYDSGKTICSQGKWTISWAEHTYI